MKADYVNPDLAALEKELTNDKNVKEVSYQKSLVSTVNQNLQKISMIFVGFSLLLLVIAILLINNTIRLSVFSKRFLIRTMQLIGATQSFIRRPFVIKGIIQGIISAIISMLLILLTFYLGMREIPELEVLKDRNLFIYLSSIVFLLGIIISWISTFFAVRKYLKIKTDYLYYF